MQKIIVVSNLNFIPEPELQAKLEELGPSYKILSAQTTAVNFVGGKDPSLMGPYPGNNHIIYIITAVVEVENAGQA